MNRSAFSAAGQAARANPFPLAGRFDLPGLEYEHCKRVIDVVASLLSLILLMPLLVAIVACVRLSGRGPILFKQKRIGRDGKLFRCYKFRTMVPDAESLLSRSPELIEQFRENYKIKSDPRVTRVGAILRRTSLDEVPQLWNVLRGDMSLIGPRPIVEPELDKYGVHADRLLTVKSLRIRVAATGQRDLLTTLTVAGYLLSSGERAAKADGAPGGLQDD